MRLLMWLYVNLKVVFKQFPMTILYMLGLPLFIGLLMGNMMTILFANPNSMEPLPLQIIDEDQSTLSNQLISFLNDESMSSYFIISNDERASTLVIPDGYEENLLTGMGGELVLEELNTNKHMLSLTVAKSILDQYHEGLFRSLSTDNPEQLSLIYDNTSLKSVYIESALALNSTTYYSVGMMSFFVFMMIMNISGASYKSAELGLNKRMYSAPLTRVRMFNYDYLANLLYCVILLSFYVLVYRVLGYSFEGPIALLLLPILATSCFMVSVGSFIGHFFSAKYGKMLALILFFLQIFIGGTFLPTDSVATFSPSYSITKMFQNYILYGTWESLKTPFLMTIAIALSLYLMTCLKEKYRFWEVKR